MSQNDMKPVNIAHSCGSMPNIGKPVSNSLIIIYYMCAIKTHINNTIQEIIAFYTNHLLAVVSISYSPSNGKSRPS